MKFQSVLSASLAALSVTFGTCGLLPQQASGKEAAGKEKAVKASGAASESFESKALSAIEPLIAAQYKGYKASFVILDSKSGQTVRFNPEGCKERYSPCSTFKIFNSMVGLDSGVIKDENHPMKWDGTVASITGWNKDQTLQTAMINSVVWYYQRLAAAVGEKRMQEFISKNHYGNEDISGGITKFWLESSLKISPDEQVEFLKKLTNDQLTFSKRSMAIVRGTMRLKTGEKGVLYGKTGSAMTDKKETMGWFVGYLVQPGNIYVFAVNIQEGEKPWGPKARALTEELFEKAGQL